MRLKKIPSLRLGGEDGKVLLKKIRDISKMLHNKKPSERNASNQFVFCEKRSGLAQFQAVSDSNLDSTIERMASTLAMQCLVRGSEPQDFAILVPVEKVLANRLESRAKELLEEGRAVANPALLSPRQQEILHSILCNHANKEIASKLNITVRTVKFHISTLLNKFGAENRSELARRASGFLRTTMDVQDGFENARPETRHDDLRPIPVDSGEPTRRKAGNARLSSQRILTA
ncbi:MAG TPA: LuxR C-terminal-related transcriptional regulator [Candidatus Acidoferrales bacterium]